MMLKAFAVSTARCTSHPLRARITRTVLFAAAAASLLAVKVGSAHAQSAASPSKPGRWELLVTGGAFVPTGSQRDFLTDAQMSAAQLSWLVRPQLAITGTFGWARSRDLVADNRPKLDVFSSDVGAEVRPSTWFAKRAVSFSPFAGVGVGARSYNYRSLDVDASNNLAGYASVGGEIGVRRVGVRLEMRDYATGFKPLTGAGKASARNDLMLMVGLRFNRARATPPSSGAPSTSSTESSSPR